jgi:hypothetical protein
MPNQNLDLAFFIMWLVPGVGLLQALILALLTGRGLPRRPTLASLTTTLFIAVGLYDLLFFANLFSVGSTKPLDAICAVQSAALTGVDMM